MAISLRLTKKLEKARLQPMMDKRLLDQMMRLILTHGWVGTLVLARPFQIKHTLQLIRMKR